MKNLLLAVALFISFSAVSQAAENRSNKITVSGRTDVWMVVCGGSGARGLSAFVKDKGNAAAPWLYVQTVNAVTGWAGPLGDDINGGDNSFGSGSPIGVVDNQAAYVYVTKSASKLAVPYDIQFQCVKDYAQLPITSIGLIQDQ